MTRTLPLEGTHHVACGAQACPLPAHLRALFLCALPNVDMDDLKKIAPVATCAAGAHLSSIFSMNLGAVSFAQIVKAAEPAFAALLGVTMYGQSISKNKWLCLIPVIGGVCLASIKELDFSVLALFAACVANIFAAFRANENKKLREAFDAAYARIKAKNT